MEPALGEFGRGDVGRNDRGEHRSRLGRRICLGSSGRKGSSGDTAAMLNMVPKFALVVWP